MREHLPLRCAVSALAFCWLVAPAALAQSQPAGAVDAAAAYKALRAFTLDGGSAKVNNLTVKRDRGEMTFTGTFYFPQPVMGKITGAVFLGKGKFRAEPPSSSFERDNLRRMISADAVEAEFESAVLRFTDDTHSIAGETHEPRGTAPPEAQTLATEFETRMLREIGANIASRLLLSLVNAESPGFFLVQFEKSTRGRFTFLVDQQSRIPTVNFGINGGEKGLVFAYDRDTYSNNVWFAFYSLEDYQRGVVPFSDRYDLITTPKYSMLVDLREPKKLIKVTARPEISPLMDNVRAIPFALTENLPEYDQLRRKKGMRITSAKLADGTPLQAIQEEWEGGFTIVLPAARKAGEKFQVEMNVEGNFIYDRSETFDCSYPFINGEWYPRHGYLSRSTYDITFLHPKKHKVAGPGARMKEEPSKEDGGAVLTRYQIDRPVALVTFAMGPYKIYQEQRKLIEGQLPVEFFSLEGSRSITVGQSSPSLGQGMDTQTLQLTIKEDFVLAEMGNAVDYMGALFGAYPYPVFRAAFHPFGFGQGFATMLAIPNADAAHAGTFVFLSHETAHQWWGNIVAWRSYRDQWLSEGFAEYSGLLYMQQRTKSVANMRERLGAYRDALKAPPRTTTGIGANRVTDIGPIILGLRLASSRSSNAYTILTYYKGALVLRMLHFLLSNPSTGDGKPFFEMMQDFVKTYKDDSASTEQFAKIAGEHFAKSPVGQKYGLPDLNWFFRQWVWGTALPSYRLEYTIENQPDGKAAVKGTVYQENAPENWFMPLPVVMKFGGGRVARGTILARGPQSPVNIMVPARPESVELDPDMWVLSDKTTTKKQ